MKLGAKLIIATDHDSYKTWILAEIANSKKFTWDAKSKKDWQVFPKDWVATKYQKKAVQEGRTSVIFNLTYSCQNS
jgi:tRNA G46 methylase TrmB